MMIIIIMRLSVARKHASSVAPPLRVRAAWPHRHTDTPLCLEGVAAVGARRTRGASHIGTAKNTSGVVYQPLVGGAAHLIAYAGGAIQGVALRDAWRMQCATPPRNGARSIGAH
jgi:hypothetical protein